MDSGSFDSKRGNKVKMKKNSEVGRAANQLPSAAGYERKMGKMLSLPGSVSALDPRSSEDQNSCCE